MGSTNKKQVWKKFKTETGLEAKALVKDGQWVRVKVISEVPRMHYYSCLNEALKTADELWQPKAVRPTSGWESYNEES